MSSVNCVGTEPGAVHVEAVGVAPLATAGSGLTIDPLMVLDVPPIVNSTVTPTNFTFGNAQHLSYHLLDGKTMYFWWRIIFGTTSTFTANPFGITITGSTPHLGTGNVKDGMPVGAFKVSNAALTNHFYGNIIISAAGGSLRFRYIDDVGFGAETLVTQAVPLTFGNNVVFSGHASYEVN